MSIPFTDLASQYALLRADVHERIARVLERGKYIMGPEVYELEEQLQSYTGAKYCITVGSGTDALLISLMALDVGPGDEVITTPFSFGATAEVIALLGATPVFVDIEIDTCNINASLISSAITKNTKAILPVSLYGQPADMDGINRVAQEHGNLPVIEDAAQSFGAKYKARMSCNLSTLGCTSFFPSKPLGCYGDGGAIFTNDEYLAKKCRAIRVHGQTHRYQHDRVGVGGRMDTIQCAVVLAKLRLFDDEILRRNQIAKNYDAGVKKLGMKSMYLAAGRSCVYAQYTVFSDERDQLAEYLAARGIPTAIHYPKPLYKHPAYSKTSKWSACPVVENAADRVLSLPMSAYLSEEDQSLILEKIGSFYLYSARTS